MVEAGYANGSASIGDWKYDKTILSAKAKYFVGDSLYVDGGFGMEQWSVDYGVLTGEGFFETKSMSGDVTNLGVEFHIGNQWQWDNFKIGCDWIGGFAVLSNSKSFASNSEMDQDSKKSEEDTIASNTTGSSLHLTRFYLGYAF